MVTPPHLPDDCIYDILKYLQSCRSTLFNCLLVNRFWCRETIPLLYADPFCNIINNNRFSIIILNLILCFKKSEILQLKNELKHMCIDDININEEYKPLFSYHKYLKNYNFGEINSIITKWLNNKQCETFISIFHKSILCQLNKIKQLNISLVPLSRYKKNCNIQTFTSNLTNLNSLSLSGIDSDIAPEFLENISKICLNFRKLEIASIRHNTSVNATICTIIQKQRKLQDFIVSYCKHDLLNDIFSSLEFQKNSLVYIKFKGVNFSEISFKNFRNLCNLKYLKFDNCREMSLEKCEILKSVSFKLKKLTFDNNTWDGNVTSLLIKYLCESLKELILNERLEILILENISNCLDLNTLEIKITNNNLLVFSCLKKLRIRSLILNVDIYHNINENFTILANNLSINVKEIFFRFRNSISFQYINKFLENCHNCLELIGLNHLIGLDFIEIILNYNERSNNSLRSLVMLKKNLINDDALKLLETKGVGALDFSTYEEDNSLSFYRY